eukprot:scaffold10558_cov241-Chaetoceros_neogracile.AAC.4
MFRLFAVCHRVSTNNVFAGKYRQTDVLRKDTDRQTAPQSKTFLKFINPTIPSFPDSEEPLRALAQSKPCLAQRDPSDHFNTLLVARRAHQ